MMKFHVSKSIVAVLSVFASITVTTGIANAQVMGNIRIPIQSVSGTIVNAGSNNGGQPNFACNDINIFASKLITTKPPADGGITMPKYEQISSSVKAIGNIATGCKYTLPLSLSATKQPIYVFAVSPRKWTTAIDSIEISPTGWTNPVQVAPGVNLINRNLRIIPIRNTLRVTLLLRSKRSAAST